MNMGLLSSSPGPAWPGDAHTTQQIMDRLTLWREHLLEHNAGASTLTRREIIGQLDHWLDELLNRRGR